MWVLFLLTSSPLTNQSVNQGQGPSPFSIPQQPSHFLTSQEANGRRRGNLRQSSSDATEQGELDDLNKTISPDYRDPTQNN